MNPALESLLAKHKALLGANQFADLSEDQQMEICKYRKQIMEQYWHCFEKASEAKNYDVAVSYFIAAKTMGYYKAITLYSKKIKNPCAQENIELSTELCSPDEQFIEGMRYTLGLGVEQNIPKAEYLYQTAAELKHAEAQYYLGTLYQVSFIGSQNNEDMRLALFWFRMAAEQGHAQAQCDVGAAYQSGSGVTEDVQEALHWYQIAADQGYIAALYMMANYASNLEDPQAIEQGIFGYRLAAEQGYAKALNKLAVSASKHEPRDLNKILWIYRLAAEQGSTNAQKSLDRIHTPFAIYLQAMLNNDFSRTAKSLIENVECRQEFIDYELDKALSEINGIKRIKKIIKEMLLLTAAPGLINNFMIHVLLSFYKKSINSVCYYDKEGVYLIERLASAINFIDTEPENIQPIMRLILDNWWTNQDDFTGLKELKTLWYRAQSIDYALDDSDLRMQIATMLIKYHWHNTYTLRMVAVSNFQLGLLFMLYRENFDAAAHSHIENVWIPLMRRSDCEHSPLKLLPKLQLFLADDLRWGKKKPALIQQIEDDLADELVKNKPLDELNALKIFSQLCEGIEIMQDNYKNQSGFFAIKSNEVKKLFTLLVEKNTEKLYEYIHQPFELMGNPNEGVV